MSKQIQKISEIFKQCSNDQVFKEGISKGMLKGYHSKLSEEDIAMTCPGCNFIVPKYQGRYPSKCPDCGKDFKESFAELNAMNVDKSFKLGEQVKYKNEEQEYDATIVSKCMESGKFTVMLKNANELSGKLIREVEIGNLSAPAIDAKA